MKTWIVIPSFNEAATILDVVKRSRDYCENVLVVDDGSTDGTATVVSDQPITILRNDTNCGKGSSLWRGAMHAIENGADCVITLDADSQHKPEQIPELLEQHTRYPEHIVIASRTCTRENVPALRDFANRCANFWISWAAGYPITDTQSGFRLYPVEVFRKIPVRHDASRGFVFESEVLIECARRGIYSVPVAIEAIYSVCKRPSYYRPAVDTAKIIRMVAWKLLTRAMNLPGLLRSMGLMTNPAPAAKVTHLHAELPKEKS